MIQKLLVAFAVVSIGIAMPAADTMARGGGHGGIGAGGHRGFFGHHLDHFTHHDHHDRDRHDHHDHRFGHRDFDHWRSGPHFAHWQPGRWRVSGSFGGHDGHGWDEGVWHR